MIVAGQSPARLYLVLWLLIAALSTPLLVVGVKQVIAARDRARRSMCVNSLKQISKTLNVQKQRDLQGPGDLLGDVFSLNPEP